MIYKKSAVVSNQDISISEGPEFAQTSSICMFRESANAVTWSSYARGNPVLWGEDVNSFSTKFDGLRIYHSK